MARERKRRSATGEYTVGVPFETALARRERFADNYDIDFGQERIFPELVAALLDEVPDGSSVLEVGAATGLLTRPLLEKAGFVTALEPSAGMLRRLLESDVAQSERLATMQGMVEDLPANLAYDMAVVTFTPRRGTALAKLLVELATRVADRVVMLLEEERSMDWAYLARAVSSLGFDVRLHLVNGGDRKRAVVLVANVHTWVPRPETDEEWVLDARTLDVPYPPPRGAATRLMRYFLSGGDRALVLHTDPRGVERLYGNLRTAAHRLGRSEVTVRREADSVQLVRLPRQGAENGE